jgi:hypothetical protein
MSGHEKVMPGKGQINQKEVMSCQKDVGGQVRSPGQVMRSPRPEVNLDQEVMSGHKATSGQVRTSLKRDEVTRCEVR